ncbi:hypothetical protein PUP75_26460 [Pseudomonas chlororaphis]|uniref:hypothetical protein n=1 Tax=Pseudomonas chlororaphis TaxID=587753 RepID=UPI002368AD2D|nr:hypothetical protein [Pseudomonas chlororaphis]WDH52437.1 hypothetical protein PUP75_26460 [Pseudomonas chlororaphis]
MKTSTLLRITRVQYREFAETTKSIGMALNLSSFKRMEKSWGTYSPWALLVCNDVRENEPSWKERSLITLAASINSEQLRSNGARRIELDWGVLEDHEIYPFILWHEIGHRVDNFSIIEIMLMNDLEVRDRCHSFIRSTNELLADRYAWNHIRPGEPIPLSEIGKRHQETAAEALAYLNKRALRNSPCKCPLAAGQYFDVPEYMLDGAQRAAFIGPDVSRSLVANITARHKKRITEGKRPLY